MEKIISIPVSSVPSVMKKVSSVPSVMNKNVLRCTKCNKKSFMNIECSYCHLLFCVADRLPETHHCISIDLSRKNDLVLSKLSTPKVDKL